MKSETLRQTKTCKIIFLKGDNLKKSFHALQQYYFFTPFYQLIHCRIFYFM